MEKIGLMYDCLDFLLEKTKLGFLGEIATRQVVDFSTMTKNRRGNRAVVGAANF